MPKKSKMPKKSPHEKLLTELANYEKKVGMLAPKPPSNARMKLRKYNPVKKHAITLKSLVYDDPDFDLTGEGPRRSGKTITKAFSAYDPGYDETAAFLKSKGLGLYTKRKQQKQRKRKGYY